MLRALTWHHEGCLLIQNCPRLLSESCDKSLEWFMWALHSCIHLWIELLQVWVSETEKHPRVPCPQEAYLLFEKSKVWIIWIEEVQSKKGYVKGQVSILKTSALNSGLTEIRQAQIIRKVFVKNGPTRLPLTYVALYGNRWILHTSSLIWVSCCYCHFKAEDTEA